MFSGIVQQTSVVTAAHPQGGLMRLVVDMGAAATGLQIGASVSIAGVCLTAVEIQGSAVVFDVMQETLQKTMLGSLRVGDRVNTERSVRVGDELGGHRVSGHVTGTVEIIQIDLSAQNHIVTFRGDAAWMEFILPKGFIALDGCSLTVVDVGADWFTVHLIPATLAITTFGAKTIGDNVNMELDAETQAIVATVKRVLAARA